MQYSPVFCAIAKGGATENSLHGIGVKVVCLGLNPRIPNFYAVYRLTQFFLKTRPLIVHAHGAEANFHGLLAAMIARVPVRIGEEIGIPSHSRKAKLIFHLIYRLSHQVIGISKSVTDWLLSSREVRPEHAMCLYNPVELPVVRKPQEQGPLSVFRVCFVGRLESVKNPLALVRATRDLVAKGVPIEIWLIGDGSQREQIERDVLSLGLSREVKLLGFQSDPFQFVRQCNLYVQPSLSEGFGIAMVEAMGCGLPVVVTNVGGAPEIVSHGVTGWLLRDTSSGTLAETLHAAWLLGPEGLAGMGQLARSSVEGRFEPASYLKQLEEMYARVAQERGLGIAG
jgi:glycosyltransferase involved in cell wall biosynthesis